MPPQLCPHCQKTNPETAKFCYFDGEVLRGGSATAQRPARQAAASGNGPRLDLNPRRVHLGNVLAGETRQVPLTVSNQGQGVLTGTLTVAEGGEWLRVGNGGNGQCEFKIPREQKVSLQVDTRGLPASQTYGARLTIVTNGGVVEVPVRMDLAAHPFPRAPFQGARAPRELAERMRTQPKAAVPMLESGEVAKWFAANGWNYPVRGAPARGVAGIQQFFECMGLSKPPVVQVSQSEMRIHCNSGNPLRREVTLSTASKKWVYANVESDEPWLKVLTPQVAGPQQTTIAFEVDPRQMPRGRVAEGALTVSANGGQNLIVRVRAQAAAAGPTNVVGRLLRGVLAGALACLLLRLLLAPLVDGYARGAATDAALHQMGALLAGAESPLTELGGWLHLPWPGILLASNPTLLNDFVGPAGNMLPNPTRTFRDEFASHFIRLVALWTWWVGALLCAWVVCRRAGWVNLPWGLVAGAGAGVVGGATLACLILVGDLIPHAIWALTSGAGGAGMLVVWILIALVSWTTLGAAVGAVLALTGPLGRPLLDPVLGTLAGLFRMVGLRGLSAYFTPV